MEFDKNALDAEMPSLEEFLMNLFSSMGTKADLKNAEGSLTSLLLAGMTLYTTSGETGGPEFSEAFGAFLQHLQNPNEPMVKEIGPMQKMVLFPIVNTLKKQKEKYDNGRNKKD